MQYKKILEILFIGFALFATYFGAGNLIFPPIIGLQSGTGWILSIAGLATSGILLPVLAMIVIGLCGSVINITKHVSKDFYNIIIGAIMFIVIFVANPRTAATAVEMGVQGIIPQAPYVLCVVIYFALVFWLARNKGKVLDNVGKYLTPAMVVILTTLIIMAFASPIGKPLDTRLEKPFVHAFLVGYNTGDVLVSFLLASVFLGMIEGKGYLGNDRSKVAIKASLIAFCGLFIVYSGLLYMGACGSGIFPSNIGRAELLVALIQMVGGKAAMVGLGIAAILACLTTAIAQATAAADYIAQLSKDRLSYTPAAGAVCVVSMLIAIIGVDKIVVLSNPLYIAIYPVVLALMILGIFNKVIPNDGGYRGAIVLTLAYSICEAILSFGVPIEGLQKIVSGMPLASYGFGWICPCLIGFVSGLLLHPRLVQKGFVDTKEEIQQV